MSRTLAALFMFVVTATCTIPVQAKVILILGDSLSAGFGIAQQQSWPALLELRLTTQGYAYGVANISISGETTRGGLSRLPLALKQHNPAIVIIALGANDGLRGLPLEQMHENLRTMIQQCKETHAKVLLVGMQLPPNYGAEYTRKFRETFSDLARQQKIALEPFLFAGFADRQEAFQNDGIHPTAKTQTLMLDNVWRSLQPLLMKH